MIIYLYRWKLKPEKEQQFINAWSCVTKQLREKSGSLGSRLHRGSDGFWCGYAQWPSIEVREKSALDDEEIVEARRLMKDAILESLPEIVLEPVSDFLCFPGAKS